MPLLLPLLVACGDGKVVEFPAGLEPLEPIVADCPSGADDAVTTESGETDEWTWTHGCGAVRAPYAAVVAAVRDPDVGVDRRKVAEYTVTWDVEPEYEVSYAVATIVHDLVDVEYTLTWRHGDVTDGEGATRWRMTETDPFVSLIEGSVTTLQDADDPDLTWLHVVYHVDAPAQMNPDVTRTFVEDLHASVAAVAAGEPLPTYE